MIRRCFAIFVAISVVVAIAAVFECATAGQRIENTKEPTVQELKSAVVKWLDETEKTTAYNIFIPDTAIIKTIDSMKYYCAAVMKGPGNCWTTLYLNRVNGVMMVLQTRLGFFGDEKSIQYCQDVTREQKKAAPSISSTETKTKLPLKDESLFPKFNLALEGTNEVRVKNPNDFDVLVGIRSGGGGKNFSVASNGVASVFVPNGKYEIYFVYSNKPDALFKGDDFCLDNNGIEIQIVKVVGGNYGIKRVK